MIARVHCEDYVIFCTGYELSVTPKKDLQSPAEIRRIEAKIPDICSACFPVSLM